MPRKSKPQSANLVGQDQPYGMAGEQQAAMKTVPLPNNTTPMPTAQGTQPAVGAPPSDGNPTPLTTPGVAPATAPSNPMGNALIAALSTPPPGPGAFSQPTTRPAEPVTTMPQPGQPVPNNTPTADILRKMALAAGNDPAILAMANNAAAKGY
jgi:hypothetical protein